MRLPSGTGLSRAEIESAYGGRFIDGNDVELLVSSQSAFDRIFSTVRGAMQFICLQFYIYRNDETGTELAELLKKKASEGISVYVIYDHFGSLGTPRKFWRSMRAAGINVRASYPFVWHSPRRYVYRDHRKVIIIDGHTAFTGGLNIANEYSDGLSLLRKKGQRPWKDTGVIIKGPAAGALLETFARAWRRWSGQRLSFGLSVPKRMGPLPAMPIFAHTSRGRRKMRRLLHYSIGAARKEKSLATAYFTPSGRMFNSLQAAVKRGVRVRLMVPWHSDVAAADYACRASFSRLLKFGVEIYAYQGRMLHSKAYVFDCLWSIVGSANLDYRSLRWNDEGNVGILDDGFSRQICRLFDDDLKNCLGIELQQWSRRPLVEKAKEWLFSMIRRKL